MRYHISTISYSNFACQWCFQVFLGVFYIFCIGQLHGEMVAEKCASSESHVLSPRTQRAQVSQRADTRYVIPVPFVAEIQSVDRAGNYSFQKKIF